VPLKLVIDIRKITEIPEKFHPYPLLCPAALLDENYF
jgi:hypothetical protein